MLRKILLSLALFVGANVVLTCLHKLGEKEAIALAPNQLVDGGQAREQMENYHWERSMRVVGMNMAVVGIIFGIFYPEILRSYVRLKLKKSPLWCLLFLTLTLTGCWRPFEPNVLKMIETNETAFLIPLKGDIKDQVAVSKEDYTEANLVHTRQVKIPQQWVQMGYEWFGVPNGEWRDAALLVKVEVSPITREWTADPNSGTSNKNEAIWVMTSDQVEWSTGWTCTARIASSKDAILFLSNYPNGTLAKVMDTEIRGKIQTVFGLEVTDQKMEKLRDEARPHIEKTAKEVTAFFLERGITITNLGISGGYIYKDQKIIDKLVSAFNAEQEIQIAKSAALAQEETNKKLKAEAEGKAAALRLEKEAEAETIQLVADAKSYELEKAKEDVHLYLLLKKLEVEREKLKVWDGRFPTYFMGEGGPEVLLQIPLEIPETEKLQEEVKK